MSKKITKIANIVGEKACHMPFIEVYINDNMLINININEFNEYKKFITVFIDEDGEFMDNNIVFYKEFKKINLRLIKKYISILTKKFSK